MSMLSNVRTLDFKHYENVKSVFEHISLYIGLFVYTAAGAKIFQVLEHPLEVETLEDIQSLVIYERENFVRFIFNGSWNSVQHRENIDSKLLEYEQVVAVAANEGIDLGSKEPIYQWSYIQAVFFASTILTTIGYGNIAPVSTAGRVFCMLFAIVGIPFTLSVIADVGQIFATIISTIWKKYKHVIKPAIKNSKEWYAAKMKAFRRWRRRRRAKAEGVELEELEEEDDDDDDGPGVGLKSNLLTAFFALSFLTCFLAIGTVIFRTWETWTFFDAFYFCFITMTTIGFGDIVPDIVGEGKTAYMLVCMIYILVGLAFTSTIIELVRRQYAESWRKMQELRAQIQAQIKLAATLRQMADAAGKNNLELEGMDIAGDLDALKANIAKFKKGKYGKGLADIDIDDLQWMDGSKKVKAVTIFIYESSV